MKDLARKMQSLYETNEYFVRIDNEEVSYEEDYWGERTDPDGKKRYNINEIEHSIEQTNYITEFVNAQEPGVILDVGCGLGSFLSTIDDKWEKHGIEISKFASEYAKQHCKIHTGTLFDFPFEEQSFDLINMHHVIEHVDDPGAVITRVRDLLKDDGVFIIATPDFDSGAARRFGENYRMLDPGHIRLFSNDSMHRFLRDNGFHIFRVDYPYFETKYFNEENLFRLFDTSKVSPAFYGNFMTFFVRKS